MAQCANIIRALSAGGASRKCSNFWNHFYLFSVGFRIYESYHRWTKFNPVFIVDSFRIKEVYL